MDDPAPVPPPAPPATNEQLLAAIAQMAQQIQALQNQVNDDGFNISASLPASPRLLNFAAPPPAAAPAPRMNYKAPKIPSPAIFTGDMAKCTIFIGQCENYFRLRAFEFRTYKEKVAFALSLIQGPTVNGFVEHALEHIGYHENSLVER